MASLTHAIQVLHQRYQIPHVVITSVALSHPDHPLSSLSVVGSTMTSDHKARLFKIVFPAIDAYFSGTGDMFAALMVVRMREAVWNTPGEELRRTTSWVSGDEVDALDLPLASAAEKVLASMHEVLAKTRESMNVEVERVKGEIASASQGEEEAKKRLHLRESRAAEMKLVRHLDSMRHPKVKFRAQKM